MRLMVIEPGLKLWGSERAFLATVPALAAAWERVIVMLPPGAELARELAGRGVDVIEAPIGNLHRSGPALRIAAARGIAAACRRHDVDKLYLNQAGLCRIVHAIARLLSLPLAIHVRLVEDIARCERLPASRRAPVDLIFISEDMRRRYNQSGGRDAARVSMAYDVYELPVEGRSASLPELDFMCAGRLAGIKGQAELVGALSIVREIMPHAALDIIGASAPGDDYEAKLRDAVQSTCGHEAVRLLGYRTDVPRLMRAYRFAVIPSRYEPLGRVALEAWEAGALPIASAESGGLAEIVRASGGGLLARDNSSRSLAACMLEALSMPESERLTLVERGRAWMHAEMSMRSYRQALAGVLFPASMAA